MTQNKLNNRDICIIISFLALLTPLVLYLSRSIDDNRLTSWKWVFANTNFADFFVLFILAIGCSYVLTYIGTSRIFENRQPVALFIMSFLLSTLFWQEPEVIVDASRYFSQAKHLEFHGLSSFFSQWGKTIFAWTDLPLIPFFYGLTFKLFGESRIYIQILTSLFYSGTIVSTYFLGKTLWDKEIGLYAALLLFGFPYLFTQTGLMLVDVPTMFFIIFALLTFIKAITRGGVYTIFMAAAAFFLAFYVKYSIWMLLSVLGIATLVYLRSAPDLILKRTILVALLALISISIIILFYQEIITNQIALLISYQKPGLKRWSESLASTFLFQIHPFITASAVCSTIVALKAKDSRYLIIGYLVFLVLIVLQLKRIRYTLPIFPMIALMASYGIREIGDKEIKDFFVYSIITCSLVIAIAGFLPFLKNMSAINIMRSGEYLDSLKGDSVYVFTIPSEKPIVNPLVDIGLIDYFTHKNVVYLGGIEPDINFDEVKTSSLRFTWEYTLPDIYKKNSSLPGPSDTLLIISGKPLSQPYPDRILPWLDNYRLSKQFNTATGIFRYNTFVSVYSRNQETTVTSIK